VLPIFPATTRILSRIFRMDAIDRKILAELQQDGRISVTDLAQKVGLSLSPCHRRLRALVAIELKVGEFQPEFVGKMQFYLAALDAQVRQPDENPSIGIILCKARYWLQRNQ